MHEKSIKDNVSRYNYNYDRINISQLATKSICTVTAVGKNRVFDPDMFI